MKIPETLVILSVPWAVDVMADESGEGATMKAQSTIGRCDFVNRRIIMLASLEGEAARQTLYHEMCHAILDELGLQQDEHRISAFAAVLADTLVRNGLVVP